METRTLTVRVPASTSNLGAGFDCLGLALDLWLEARLIEGEGTPIYGGTLEWISPQEDFLLLALGSTVPPGQRLEVTSSIPVSRGLGSSAAARVAGLVLARLAQDLPIERDGIFKAALTLEGHPDNAGPAVYGGLVLSAGRPTKLRLHESLGVALALPEQRMSTQAARAMLPSQMSREETVAQASRSAALVLGLTLGDGDLIRYGMDDRVAVPQRKQLVTGYDAAVQAGIEAGAFHVTLSGAGSGLVAVATNGCTSDAAEAMASALGSRGNTAVPLTPAVVEDGFVL
ncbi:MAG: homoserine kinase [Gemmatimonadota bacterium]|nr:MAG: homoserine kinase [Gemmatimonadota bacterium]